MSNFRLRLKVGQQLPAPAEPLLVTRPKKERGVVAQPAPQGEASRQVSTCHAFLQVFDDKPEKVNTGARPGNYAVIGRGFSATVNVATLRAADNKDRIRTQKLLLIGLPDPWSVYVQHNMNQELELLTLPGYKNRPAHRAWSAEPRWLDSRAFAALNAQEMQRLVDGDAGAAEPDGFFTERIVIPVAVKKVERVGTRFKLHLSDGRIIKRVRHVDICTGTGQQTYMEGTDGGERGIGMPETLWNEYLQPHAREGGLPRVWSAEMYVAGNRQVKAGGSVLITSAASPAGVQAGEHALCLDTGGFGGAPAAEVVLLASRKINDAFLPIGRLDGLARTASGPLPMRVVTDPAVPLIPTDPRLWFGEDHRAVNVQALNEAHLDVLEHEDGSPLRPEDIAAGKLLVCFKDDGKRFVGCASNGDAVEEAPLLYGLFDQVVFNTGRNRGGRGRAQEEEEGSALQLVWGLRGGLGVIPAADGYDFPLGLQLDTGKGLLRVLGAAGINNPIYAADEAGKRAFERYEDSLPWQARVAGEGVTLSAVTIALANKYFKHDGTHRNPSVNTATRSELALALNGNTDMARKIHAARHWRVRPFVSLKEVARATEYWQHFFDRDDLNTMMAQRTGRNIKELSGYVYTVPELNNHGFLVDDGRWAAEKRAAADRNIWPWVELALTAEQIDAALRYRDHIADADSRDKVVDPSP